VFMQLMCQQQIGRNPAPEIPHLPAIEKALNVLWEIRNASASG
jgi:hypothetical protein